MTAPVLSPFDRWMVKMNLERTKTEGVEAVIANLRVQGYHRVADAVQAVRNQNKN